MIDRFEDPPMIDREIQTSAEMRSRQGELAYKLTTLQEAVRFTREADYAAVAAQEVAVHYLQLLIKDTTEELTRLQAELAELDEPTV